MAGSSIPEDATILKAEDVATIRDQLYAVRCAAEDISTASEEGASHAELQPLIEELIELAKEAERFR